MGTTEEWKVIDGFEEYMVSSTGKVAHKGRILKGSSNGSGYIKVGLVHGSKRKKEYIHRLVAFAFIPNPANKPFINHIDNDPTNNDVENLEWCTHQENMDWMILQGRAKRTPEWIQHLHEAQSKDYVAVVGENIQTGEKLYFSKLNDVREAGFQPSCVCNCCKGNRGIKQHKGYRWRYEAISNS